ncbi:MAG: peptidoglycan-binding protein [Clostridia bacterium]|nr:peptidoglycan-binding protein [Clostridia bacterium]
MSKLKWMRCVLAAVLCVLLVISTAACSQPVNIEAGPISTEYPVEVNGLTIQSKPQKVAVLSGSLADVILAIGYETSLVLGSEDCTQPELQVLQKAAPEDTAAIIASGAQLVLAETMEDSVRVILEEAGVPVLLLNRAVNREDFERLYSEVGTALNGSGTGYNAGVKAAQKIFSSLDDISRLVPESPTVVTACFISDLNGAAVTGDELGSVMMSYMGLTNVFKGRQGGTFAYEDLLLSDPTMIFCTEEVQTQLLSDAKYAELTAIATGRVYAIDPKYMEWQGKTVYTAALEMMGLAYPELTETSEASVTMPTATPKPTPEPTPEPTEEPSPSPEATPIPEYDPIPSGDQGEHVFYMQQRLAELGYLTAEYDGFYGEATKESVKAFQTANGLEATGEVDAITHAMIYYEKAVRADGTTAAPAPTPSAEPDETA